MASVGLSAQEIEEYSSKDGRTWWRRVSDGVHVCGAPLRRRAGRFCARAKGLSVTNGRCRTHGATGGRPTTHGLYSQAMGPLREAYLEFVEGPDRLDVNPQLAVLDTLAQDLLRRATEDGDTPKFREAAYRAGLELREALGSKDPGAIAGRLNALLSLLRDGYERSRALSEVRGVVAERARIAQNEQKNILRAERMITERAFEQFLSVLFATLAEDLEAGIASRVTAKLHRTMRGAGAPSLRLAE